MFAIKFGTIFASIAFSTTVLCQRSPYAGSRPIGYKDKLQDNTQQMTTEVVVNRFGEDPNYVQRPPINVNSVVVAEPNFASIAPQPSQNTIVDLNNRFGDNNAVTFPNLPHEAYGDQDLIDRYNREQLNNRPFWLLNQGAIESQKGGAGGTGVTQNQQQQQQQQNQQGLIVAGANNNVPRRRNQTPQVTSLAAQNEAVLAANQAAQTTIAIRNQAGPPATQVGGLQVRPISNQILNLQNVPLVGNVGNDQSIQRPFIGASQTLDLPATEFPFNQNMILPVSENMNSRLPPQPQRFIRGPVNIQNTRNNGPFGSFGDFGSYRNNPNLLWNDYHPYHHHPHYPEFY